MNEPTRMHGWWWCDQSETFHAGHLENFPIEHRQHLHPAFAVIEDRAALTEGTDI